MIIETGIYRNEPTAYIRELILRWMSRYVWVYILMVALCVAFAAFYDTAFLFVATILTFLVFPFVVAMVYFNYGLKPRATSWGMKRRLKIDDGCLIVECFSDEFHKKTPEPLKIPLSDIRSLKLGKRNDTICYGPGLDDFIIVAEDAFAEEDSSHRERFHELIYATIQRNSLNLQS